MSQATREAADDWDPMYVDGEKPFGSVPFPGLDEVLAKNVELGGKVLDLGAGYGRDSFFLAKEFGCDVTAVELSRSGCDAMERAAAQRESVGDGTVRSVCSCVSEFDIVAEQGRSEYDLVLMFIQPKLQEGAIVLALRALKPGGKLVVIGWKEEEAVARLRQCITAAAAALPGVETEGGVQVAKPYTVECDVAFNGETETTHMEWAVVVVTKKFPDLLLFGMCGCSCRPEPPETNGKQRQEYSCANAN